MESFRCIIKEINTCTVNIDGKNKLEVIKKIRRGEYSVDQRDINVIIKSIQKQKEEKINEKNF
jgi:hypothetical protein